MSFATGGAFPPSLLPSAKKQALGTNYLSFNGGSDAGDSNSFAQQYLPELYEAEVERYGNRTLQGFLRMVGAEMPMSSDQVIWTEQNRLHIAYDDCTQTGAGNTINVNPGGAANIINVISPQQTVVVMDDFGNESKCLVAISGTCLLYTSPSPRDS